jgi:ABC-2 type transport system ATP-binding protein
MSAIIKFENVYKHYPDVKALDGVSFEVEKGQVLGLLGPNGAGKTTAIRILTTLRTPDKGRASVAGYDVVKDKEKLRTVIGLAGQSAAVDETLTGYENLEMVGRLYHLTKKSAKEKAKKLLEDMRLKSAGDRVVKNYSGGMRRRLDIAASLLGDPQVLFLDEPTTGLDPRTRNDLWEIVRTMAKRGTTVVLTTQYLDEADALADNIVLINDGRVVAEGSASELKRKLGGDVIELELKDWEHHKKVAQMFKTTLSKDVQILDSKRIVAIPTDNGPTDLQKVLDALSGEKIELTHVSLSQPSLDDVFLSLTGEDNDEA